MIKSVAMSAQSVKKAKSRHNYVNKIENIADFEAEKRAVFPVYI
jgi:hypothetical protein